MVAEGDADAMVTGVTRNFSVALEEVRRVIDDRPGHRVAGVSIIISHGRPILVADTAITEMPNAEDLAEIAIEAAGVARRLGYEPRVAMLAFSNFGHPVGERGQRVQEAVRILDSRKGRFRVRRRNGRRRRPEQGADGRLSVLPPDGYGERSRHAGVPLRRHLDQNAAGARRRYGPRPVDRRPREVGSDRLRSPPRTPTSSTWLRWPASTSAGEGALPTAAASYPTGTVVVSGLQDCPEIDRFLRLADLLGKSGAFAREPGEERSAAWSGRSADVHRRREGVAALGGGPQVILDRDSGSELIDPETQPARVLGKQRVVRRQRGRIGQFEIALRARARQEVGGAAFVPAVKPGDLAVARRWLAERRASPSGNMCRASPSGRPPEPSRRRPRAQRSPARCAGRPRESMRATPRLARNRRHAFRWLARQASSKRVSPFVVSALFVPSTAGARA